jgi:ABC-type glycerol-3-phosphate transport system substrate-binding protein
VVIKKITIMLTCFILILTLYQKTYTPIKEQAVISLMSEHTEQLNRYSHVLQQWKSEGLQDDIDFHAVVPPSDLIFETASLVDDPSDQSRQVLKWDTTEHIKIPVEVETTGLYVLSLEVYSIVQTIRPISLEVNVNQRLPYDEASRFEIFNIWTSNETIVQDRFNNDIVPQSRQQFLWQTFYFHDNVGLHENPLLFKLEAGLNEIELIKIYGDFYIGDFRVQPLPSTIHYESYLANHQNQSKMNDEMIRIEGEDFSTKNAPAIRAGNSRYPTVKPFSLMESRLNILDGSTFNQGRQQVTYHVDVEREGMYQLTFKVMQNGNPNTRVFRNIYINGELPFIEARGLSFEYQRQWQNQTVSLNGSPLWFYLEKGINEITMEVDITMYQKIYEEIIDLMAEINNLALDVQKITGNNFDEFRDWDISEFMPNLEQDLNGFYERIKNLYDLWTSIQGSKRGSPVTTSLQLAYERMDDLRKKPNELPRNMQVLSIGSGSVLAHLGNALPNTIVSAMSIDLFYIHGDDVRLPRATANFLSRIWISLQRFFLSFFSDQYSDRAEDDELEIWVNRSRLYVDLMQQMADREFSIETGQKVRIAIMPDENKLILANAANAQPDVAMGIAAWRPYEFAIRDALYDLRNFTDFGEIVESFHPGSFMQLVYQEGVYALPENQNFQLLFYRRDILNRLNIDVPNTWEDVIDILPELQRFGMNFYVPIASTSGFKSFDTTVPFINQFGGSIYTSNALSANFDDPNTIAAIRFMTQIFTLYSMPLEVGSFYNRFRYGNLPIGIGDFGMYVQLMNAAPEIAGLWDIALLPGVYHEALDIVDRSFVGAATVNVIFKDSPNKNAAWSFLKWWSSKETQVSYAENLITTYGPAFLWNTANRFAFEDMTWDERHKAVILEQWQWVSDPAKIPGSYMVERELSNIWNKVVYDGVNVRTAIEDGMIVANKEIIRKMLEFGYIDTNNQIIKPYILPTRETIHEWMVSHE